MPRRLTSANVKRIMTRRADNYAHHFDCRQTVKAMARDVQETITHAAGRLRAPTLNVYGATERSADEEHALIVLANQIGLRDPWLLNPWYTIKSGPASQKPTI